MAIVVTAEKAAPSSLLSFSRCASALDAGSASRPRSKPSLRSTRKSSAFWAAAKLQTEPNAGMSPWAGMRKSARARKVLSLLMSGDLLVAPFRDHAACVAKRHRHARRGRIGGSGGREGRGVHDVEVGHVVAGTPLVDDRALRIVPHDRGADQVPTGLGGGGGGGGGGGAGGG